MSPAPASASAGASRAAPTLAVWKFASCDGCQLALLDCEDELLTIAGRVRIASFPEATRAVAPGPYDLSLVEGSITTPQDAERIREVRAQSRYLVVLGACGTSGGIQALRNFADVDEFASAVYASPRYLSILKDSTPIRDHVKVDYELRGCPVDRRQLLEVITAYLAGRAPSIPDRSVCYECKARGAVCVTVAHDTACLGPVTHAGCGALCPAFGRGCFGCFGSTRQARVEAMARLLLTDGASPDTLLRTLSSANPADPAFRAIGDAIERKDTPGSHAPPAERTAQVRRRTRIRHTAPVEDATPVEDTASVENTAATDAAPDDERRRR